MTLFKYDPSQNHLSTGFDQWLDRVFSGRNFFEPLFESAYPREFRINLHDAGENYLLEAELPGFKKDEVELELENAVLTIRAARSVGEGENARKQSFTRSVTVGDDVNADKVKARMADGILQVILTKAEGRAPRRIAVK